MLQELQEDLAAVMNLQRVSPEVQLSIYPPHGTQYVRHRDAFPDDGSTAGIRRVWPAAGRRAQCSATDARERGHAQVTAIVYANPHWRSADRGKLRLWPPAQQLTQCSGGSAQTADALGPAGTARWRSPSNAPAGCA